MLVAICSWAASASLVIRVPAEDGALAAALARVAKAAPQPAELLLEAGEHRIAETQLLGPRHSNCVLRRADPDGTVRITGGLRILPSAWRFHSPSIVVASLNTNVVPRQMFTDDGATRATRARHPNLYDPDGVTVRDRPYLYWASQICDTHTNRSAACANASQHGLHWNASDDETFDRVRGSAASLEAVVYHGWTASRHYVSSVSADDTRTLTFTNPSDRPIGFWSGRSSEGGQRFYLENALALLDSPGEFYVDAAARRLYYMPLPGETHRNGTAYLPLLEQLILIDGASNVTIDGLTLRHADWSCGGSRRTMPCDGQSVEWQDTAAVHVRHASHVRLIDLDVSAVGPTAVWMDEGVTHALITRCRFSNLGTGAVRIGHPAHNAAFHPHRIQPAKPTAHVVLSDCTLADGSHVFAGGTAVLVQFATGVTIEHNEISNFSYTGISLGWTWNYRPQASGEHTVRYNHIHHLGYPRRETGDAMACVYTLGQLNGSTVHDNVCHDVRAYMSGGYCLSQDQGSSNLVFERNLCLRTTGSPHNTHYGVNLTYRNNVFFDGYHDTWTAKTPAAALRTSPDRRRPCPPYAAAGTCPDKLAFEGNLVGLVDNASALLFEGDWRTDNASAHSTAFAFKRNLYWAAGAGGVDLATARLFGGATPRVAHTSAYQLTWDEWRASGHDRDSALGVPCFVHPQWDQHPFNLTLAPDSPAWAIGWQPIDTRSVGPRS